MIYFFSASLHVQMPAKYEGNMKWQLYMKGADVPERFCVSMAAIVLSVGS